MSRSVFEQRATEEGTAGQGRVETVQGETRQHRDEGESTHLVPRCEVEGEGRLEDVEHQVEAHREGEHAAASQDDEEQGGADQTLTSA